MLSARALPLLAATRAPLRRAFHASAGRMATTVVNVPSMGDSISEGTIVEVVKKVGDAVHADEVVVVLETDKVSVDVTSPLAGTIVEHLAEVEENVEVGRPLFKVDDSQAPAASSKPAETVATAPSTSAPKSAATADSSSGHRVPLIKFLGKRSLLPPQPSPLSKPLAFASSPASSPLTPVQPSGPGVLPFNSTKRVPLSPAEVDSINSGLAFL